MIIFKRIFLYNRPNMEINKLFSMQLTTSLIINLVKYPPPHTNTK
ncbi:Uncharacterised protein [Serratia liquefaciens]|nr:Uncharacterised protein [Serratia liquefaciens]CAI1992347.1 Uncharacterised protein [Serratia liquefaciens]